MTDLDSRCIYDISDEDKTRCYIHGCIYRCGECEDGIDSKGEKIQKENKGWQE